MNRLWKGALAVAVAMCWTVAAWASGVGAAEETKPAWEETVHLVGKIGLAGLLVAGGVGLAILLRRPAGPARMTWRRAHVFLAVPLALASMTHGTIFFVLHLVEGKYTEILASGSWLCTSVFFLFVTGLLRYSGKGRPETLRTYHRLFQVTFLLALVWHVVPKLF
ncbi:MAG: hypothetical protein J7M26_10020 [Armatimonadetes bacterium]|nr:hypothetical protein [Armatimonadota bacterium]